MIRKVLNGVLIAVSLYGFNAVAQVPGGVTPAAWYRTDGANSLFSDAGTTAVNNNGTVQQWNEARGSGRNLVQTNAGYKPIFSNTTTLANFNPTVTFDGSNDYLQFTAGAGDNMINRASGTIYAAGYINSLKRSGFAGFHASIDYPGLHVYAPNNHLLFFTGGPGYQGQSTAAMTATSFFTAGAGWQNDAGSSAGYAGATVSLNGTRQDYSGAQLNNANLSTGARDFRIGADNNYGSFSGQLNEVLVFAGRLTGAQLDRVETYLAIKYGTTYAAGVNDYKNSAGATVWAAASNAGWQNNIAGIARDDNGALYQKQSWSTNAGRQVLIGVGGLDNTNAANGGLLADGQYLIWGDNGQAKIPSVIIAGITGISHRFGAIWKVQNTGSIGTVRVAWPKGFTNLRLIQSTDNIINAADVVTDMSANEVTINGQVYNYADVSLANGQYFTFGAKVAAPGGVSGPAVWLKANEGTAITGTSVSGWTNYGNSGGVARQLPRTATLNWALPKYGANEHNFNPAIVDDVAGTNDGSLLLEDVFPASAQRPLSSFILHSHNNVATQNNMISFTPLKQTSGALEAPYMAATAGNNLWFYWQDIYQSTPTLPNSVVRYNNIPSVNAFYVPQWVSGTQHQTTISMNGASATSPAYSINPTSRPFGNQLFIFGDGDANNLSGGKISEVITYDRDLTIIEKQQVNAYLAVKYGITLTNATGTAAANYLNSSAGVVWDTAVNRGYNKNIAGIANDVESSLNQKQSKSVNAGQQLVVGTPGLANTNALNASSMANGQYLIWGDNGLAKVPAASITGVSGVNFRFAAVWKVQNTGSVGNVRVAWPTGLTNLTLVQGTDPTFAAIASSHNMSGNVTTINGMVYNYADVTLANGNYFTLAAQLNGPGGVSLDLRVWLRSDAGFAPEEWSDLSGNANNYTQTNAGRQPFVAARQYNFNPIVDFGTTGADARFMVVPTGKPYSANGTSSTIFTATTSKTSGGYTDIIGFGSTTTGTSLTNANAPTFTKLGSSLVLYPYTSAPTLPDIALNRLYLDDVSYTVGTSGIKYGQNGQVSTVAQTFAAGNALYANGSILGAQPEVRNGFIGEVICYQRDLTNPEKIRVRSYVAIKYGMTLPHNYVASNDTTVFWNITANSGYNNNIAGVVRDDNGALNQKQSRSINSGNQVLISTTGLANSNAVNTELLGNQQFLTWGDNGLAKAPSVAIAGITGVNSRFASIWKVQNTGNVGTVRVAWPKGFLSLKLIQSTDAVFDASDIATDMAATQTVDGVEYAYTDVTLSNGQYFTFAALIQAPGGVTAGLSHWYRADIYAEAEGAGSDLTAWTDFTSGTISAQIADADLPVYRQGDSTYFNFNPGINFTDAVQKIGNITTQTLGSTSFNIFSLMKEGASGTRYFNIGMNNTSLNGINWDQPGLYTSGDIASRNNTGGAGVITNPGSFGPSTTSPSIMYYTFTNTTYSKGLNGAASSTAGTYTARGLATGGHLFGANSGAGTTGDDAGFIGHIGELIVYGNDTINAADRNKVDAYLAIKYGVTLNNTRNYITSQNVVVWNAAANSKYYNNVAGIGNDNTSSLHQKQSRSQHTNSNNQVTIGLDDIAATNAANTGVLNDGQFLMWGDNGITQAMTNIANTYTILPYGGTSVSRRMNRVWKVQNTNNVSKEVKIRFPQNAVGTTTLTANDACAAYMIIYADDTAFTTNVLAVPLTTNGNYYEAMHAFPNGASFFTFGKATPVSSGVVHLPEAIETTNQTIENCGISTAWRYFRMSADATQKILATSGVNTANLTTTITPEGVRYDDGTTRTSVMPRIATIADSTSGVYTGVKVRVYYNQTELDNSLEPGATTSGWFRYAGDADDVIIDVFGDGRMDTAKFKVLTPDAIGVEDGIRYVEFHNINSFGSFLYLSSTQNQLTPLPVKLMNFTAGRKEGKTLLDWTTATEQNNQGFDIERSGDGRDWMSIGFVNSKTAPISSNEPRNYTFTDEKPLNGSNYYRLKQIDLNGKYEYSNVRLVTFGSGNTATTLAPNPVHNELTIQGLNGNSIILICNVFGQTLMHTMVKNVTNYTIDMVHYRPGTYLIQIRNEQGQVSNHKVIKN